MKPRIYVITFHEFNHVPSPENKMAKPLDERFLKENDRYVYYLIDKQVPQPLKNKSVILESELDATLHAAGGKYLGEWSFLLAEEKYSFCQYPFFMVSSRFYQKNLWLHKDLNQEWDQLFSHFNEYGWGYLPSYDRPIRWINLDLEKYKKNDLWRYIFYPFNESTFKLIDEIFAVKIPQDYGFTADLFCNYIGFRSRSELIQYVSFYRPLIDCFYDSNFHPKMDVSQYVRSNYGFRNEKAFTFLLEYLSHLFFFKEKHKYFALHYDGYYSINETNKEIKQLERFNLSRMDHYKRLFKWQLRRSKTEGVFAKWLYRMKKWSRDVYTEIT